MYKKNQKNDWQMTAKEREDKAFDLFAEMLIDKIENGKKTEWKKPWFTQGELAWPKALYGKSYHGMNALMLMLLCEDKGYKIPVFATRDRIFSMNNQKDAEGNRVPAVDSEGNKLPFLHVLKGEHSFPVFLSKVNIVHKETKERIKWQDYVKLSLDEQKDYNVYHNRIVHYVFNVDQTNMKEARPELYAKLEEENLPQKLEFDGEDFVFEPLDVMVDKGEWICPITPKFQNDAYYSPSKDEIVVPTKEQFLVTGKPEAYYGTMLHEMIHSTGSAKQLDRLKPAYDSEAYAREELVAELGAAMSCHRYGIDKVIKEDSIPYVQNWLEQLREKPDYIRTVLKDVKLATSIVDIRIEDIRERYLGESVKDDLREDEESAIEFDEDGDMEITVENSLEPDKKQGAGENQSPVGEQEHLRSGSLHR